MPQLTVSALPISSEQQCRNVFKIFPDNHGYYMIGSQGSCQHQNHVKLNCSQMQTRTYHLSASEVEIITGIGMAQAKNLWVQMFLCLIQSSHFQITDQIFEWISFTRYKSSFYG